MSTILPALQAQIDKVIANMPSDHREALIHGTVVVSPEAVYERVQDWAFTQGYAFVVESSTDTRVRFEYLYYKEDTRNTRNTEEKAKKRTRTHV